MAEKTSKQGDGSLDKRQKQIQVGAGLEDARYNVEFIDFLKKWGTPVLLVIAAVSFGWMGLQRWRESRQANLAMAFADYEQASMPTMQGLDANPEVLLGIAQEHDGKGAIPLMARLSAAEQWRLSAARGLRVGAQLDRTTGKYAKEDELVGGRGEYLKKAKEQYQMVADKTAGNRDLALFELTAHLGLAAVAEAELNAEAARAAYAKAEKVATDAHYPEYAALAKGRAETVDKATSGVGGLISESMVMSWEKPAPKVEAAPLPGLTPSALSGDLSGGLLTPTPVPVAPPVVVPPVVVPPVTEPNPAAVPAPAPAPSPAPVPEPAKKDEPKP